MAEVGAAASIIGIIDFGLSAAKALTEAVNNFRHAKGDIEELTTELVVTFDEAKQLQARIDENDTEGHFDPSNLETAHTCCARIRKVANELWTFVKRSAKGIPQGRQVVETDIDLTLFEKARWTQRKTFAESITAKLVAIKTDILIVLVSVSIRHGSSQAAQARKKQEIKFLKLKRKLAMQQLQLARQRRVLKGQSGTGDADGPLVSDSHQGVPEGQPSISSNSDDDQNPPTSLDEPFDGDEERQILDQARKEASAQAVEEYDRKLKAEAKRLTEEATAMRDMLRRNFGMLDENKIQAYIDEHQTSQLQISEFGPLLLGLRRQPPPPAPRSQRSASPGNAVTPKKPSKLNDFNDTFTGLSKIERLVLMDGATLLGYILSPGGYESNITRFDVTMGWIKSALAAERKQSARRKHEIPSTLQTYAQVTQSDQKLVEECLSQDSGGRVEAFILVYARKAGKKRSHFKTMLQAIIIGEVDSRASRPTILLVYAGREADLVPAVVLSEAVIESPDSEDVPSPRFHRSSLRISRPTEDPRRASDRVEAQYASSLERDRIQTRGEEERKFQLRRQVQREQDENERKKKEIIEEHEMHKAEVVAKAKWQERQMRDRIMAELEEEREKLGRVRRVKAKRHDSRRSKGKDVQQAEVSEADFDDSESDEELLRLKQEDFEGRSDDDMSSAHRSE